jgi:hypothetical protein
MDYKTWVFIANRIFTMEEEKFISEQMKRFLSQWKSHGQSLEAKGYCLKQAALVLIADERAVQASGCSIDKINHWVRSLGESMGIDFFDRFNVLVENEDGVWTLERFNPQNANKAITANLTSSNELNRLLNLKIKIP